MELQLMHGVWRADRCFRTVLVRTMSGNDEVFLLDLPSGWTTARRTSALLARLVERATGVEIPPEDLVRELTIGDRERILTMLCRQHLGDRVELVARCRAPDCASLTEVTLSFDELNAIEPSAPPVRAHELTCTDSQGHVLRVVFRLPDGRMEEHAADLAAKNPAAAADYLFGETVLAVTGEDGGPVAAGCTPEGVRTAIEDAIQDLDPALDRHAAITCQACGRRLRAELDAATILAAALGRGGDIFRQVDTLARAYHWAEADILALPTARRRLYLGLVNASGGQP